MLRGWQDLQDLLVAKVADAKAKVTEAQAKSAGVKRGFKGGGKNRGQEAVDLRPFGEAWKAHCGTNQRLQDPRALGLLVRRGVPEELRPDVWKHCLGLGVKVSARGHASTGGQGTVPPGDSATSTASAVTPLQSSNDQANHVSTPSDAPDEAEQSLTNSEAQSGQVSPPLNSEDPPVVASKGCSATTDEDAVSTVKDEDLPKGIAEVIDADVSRTFPSNAEFKQIGGAERLRSVLRQLALEDTEIGYCQSLNFLAAMFIMVFKENALAIAAVGTIFTKLGIRKWYAEGMQQLRADTIVLEGLIQEWLPAIHHTLSFHKFDLMFVSSKWFLCLFTTVLEGEAIKRVWDSMLCDGIETVFRVALALLAGKEDKIVNTKSHDDLIFLFQEGQADASPDAIIRAAYDPNLIGSLSRADLSKRRQQAASQISSTDTRSEMRRQHLQRGGVRPASILAR